MELSSGSVLSYGFEEFTNAGTATAVISKVALADAHGIRMLAAYIVPVTGRNLYGVLVGYPPAAHLAPGVDWAHRQRADGARISHAKGREVSNIVLVLKKTAAVGSARGVDVFYTESGQRYHMRTATKLLLVNMGKCPSGP